MASHKNLTTGFAVFAMRGGNDHLQPVAPVDFDALKRPVPDDSDTSEDAKYAREELEYWEDKLRGVDLVGDVQPACCRDDYTGRTVRFTLFEEMEDARDMMNAYELGYGGGGQSYFLWAFSDKYIPNDQAKRDKFVEELETGEFGVYKMMYADGGWKLESRHPVDTYSRSYCDRHRYEDHPVVQIGKQLIPDYEPQHIPDEDETDKILSPAEFVRQLRTYDGRKTIVYSIEGQRRLVTPILLKKGERVDEFILAANEEGDYSAQKNINVISQSKAEYFILKFRNVAYGVGSVKCQQSGDVTVFLDRFENLFESRPDPAIQYWAHMLDESMRGV